MHSRFIATSRSIPSERDFVRNPLSWPWSSFSALLGGRPPAGFLDVQSVMEEFGPNPVSARRRLRAFVWDGLAEDVA